MSEIEIKDEEIDKDEEAKDEVQQNRLEQATNAPINPIRVAPVNRKKAPYIFYTENKQYLREWWDEFNEDLADDGRLKYRTITQFAKAKGKTKIEQELILEMLGPMPELKPGRKLRVPWLGDWAQRRNNCFGAPRNSTEMQEFGRMLKDKLVHWDAIRAGIPYLVTDMARLENLSQQVDKMFGGQAFDQNLSPMSEKNIARFARYVSLFGDIATWKIKFWEAFITANGVNPKDPVYQQQINQITQNFTNQAGMMDGDYSELSDDPRQALEMMKCAKMLTMHAKTYNLPLPDSLREKDPEPPVVESEQNKKQDAKGRVN